MAKNQTGSSAERLTHPLLEKLGAIPAAAEGLFAYSVKIVCGKQTETNCCCVAGARPGVYATEVNIQNLNLVTAPVLKFVQPLINSGAVVAREPNVTDPTTLPRRQIELIKLPPLGGDDGRLLPHRGAAAGRAPERRHRAHHRHPDDREPVRAVRLRGLHGEPSERGRHQHRRRVHSVATTRPSATIKRYESIIGRKIEYGTHHGGCRRIVRIGLTPMTLPPDVATQTRLAYRDVASSLDRLLHAADRPPACGSGSHASETTLRPDDA